MTDRTLEAWCFEELAGVLTDHREGLAFAYADQWVADGQPPLSQSLPLDGDYESGAVAAFFGGLLPEGVQRDLIARQLGVSAGNDFAMLAALGGDTAGAVSLVAPGSEPPRTSTEVQWLSDHEVAALIDELPTRSIGSPS